MNTKILLLAIFITAAFVAAGVGLGMLPAESAILPQPAVPVGAVGGGVFGLIVSAIVMIRAGRAHRMALLAAVPPDELEQAAEQAAAKAAPRPSSAFFADLELPPAPESTEDYQPTFDSVLFALGDFEPTRDNAIDRSRNGSEPALPATSATPDLSNISKADDRPLSNVASVSPFGPGTDAARQAGSLAISGADDSTLADLADVFGAEEDDRVLPATPASTPAAGIAGRTQAMSPLNRLPRASEPAPSRPETASAEAGSNGQIDSVALFSELFGSVEDPSMLAARGARQSAMPRASFDAARQPGPQEGAAPVSRRNGQAVAKTSAPPVKTALPRPPARPARVDAAPERSNALAGLRSVRPSTSRPAVPVSAVEEAARPIAEARATVNAGAAERQARKNRPTAEQRVITARLQMGMLRNHADDARSEFKKGQVPTPRKNAPSNLIMLSKRPEDFDGAPTSEDEIRQLYREFVAALNRCGRSAEIVQYSAFAQRIQTQRRRVRAQFDGAPVNMVVRVSEGRPKIVMRPAV